MDFLVSPKDYAACFTGYHLQDCAIVNRRLISLVLRNFADCEKADSLQDEKVRKKLVWMDISDPHDTKASPPDAQDDQEGRYGGCVLEGSAVVFTAAVHRPDTQFLYAAADGFVYRYDDDGFADERNLVDALGLPESSFAFGARTVCEDLYVFGADGLVARRTDRDTWQNLSIPACPGPPLTLLSVDGFAPDDLYAVTWKAGVFHYNGRTWRRVPFPTNISLETVCCAPTGQVYVSAQRGTVFVGRDSRWNRALDGTLTLPFRDTLWYGGALWCTNDYGVWTLRDTAQGVDFARAPVPDEVYFCSGNLSTGDGRLLLGGMNGAAVFDGQQWQTLYYQPEILLGMMENEA